MLILYSKLPDELDRQQWDHLLLKLPPVWRKKVTARKHWQDRQAQLLGKLFTVYGLMQHASTPCQFTDFEYGPWGRPSLPGPWNFNLSHSRKYLVLGLIRDARLGVDVECRKPIKLTDFQKSLHPEIWQETITAADPIGHFFQTWTRLESVMKADGRGISFPTQNISISNTVAQMDGQSWYLHDFSMIPGHACSAAVNLPDVNVEIKNVEFSEFCR